MSYFGEFRTHWQPLVAATLGLSAGLSTVSYTNAILAPRLVAEFGWDRSAYAAAGATTLLIFLVLPVYGRLTDIIGVRRVATIGVIGLPVTWLGYTLLTGPIWQYLILAVLQLILGVATTPAIYSRLVAASFSQSRGLALAIAISGPPFLGAIATPPLAWVMETYGWRTGCVTFAVVMAVLGCIALSLIPRHDPRANPVQPEERKASKDYGAVTGAGAFWILLVAVLLCNLYHPVTTSQLGLVLQNSGATGEAIALLTSVIAISAVVGRFACGLALDRFPPQIVAAISLAMPAIGLAILISPYDDFWVLLSATAFLGLSWGAEGDAIAFLVAKRFAIGIYSTVMGILMAAIGVSSALASILLAATLRGSHDYNPYLTITTVAIVLGAGLLLFLRPQQAKIGEDRQHAEAFR